MDQRKAVEHFLAAITSLVEPDSGDREIVLQLGRQDLSVVLVAAMQGHPCLQRPVLIGNTQLIFLQLVSEARGLSAFLRAEHSTVHPKVLASFVMDVLYARELPESIISDDDLRYIAERFGSRDYTIRTRALKIVASRKGARIASALTAIQQHTQREKASPASQT